MIDDLDDIDSKIFRISWQNIDSGARAIASNIEREREVDAIVCWQRDAIPASIVARVLDVPMGVVHINERMNGMKVDCFPKFAKPIRSGEYNQPQPKVAIVTTMLDGKAQNVDALVALYDANKPIVMSIYSYKDIESPPDYRWALIAHGVTCIYPWEEK